jgi:ABC-2 type transport system permease protein
MRQIFLVLKREYLTRVKKKSFLLATILTPLVMPAIIIAIVYFAGQEKESRSDKVLVLDEVISVMHLMLQVLNLSTSRAT